MIGKLEVDRGIDIAVTAQDGSVVEVVIANHRPLGLASRLIGTTPNEALRQITTLFSVCRIAQGVAGCMAVEDALGVEISPAHKAARELLVRGETVMEHATCALLGWPALIGQRPTGLFALKLLRASLAEMWRAIYPDGDWMQPGGGRLAPDQTAIYARLASAKTALQEAGLCLSLNARGWRNSLVACGPTAKLVGVLEEEGLAGCGISDMALLGHLDRGMLEQHLASDRDGSYAAQPELQGSAQETGPLARRMTEPLLQEIVAEHGLGLASRFFAQSIDTTRCLDEMADIADGVLGSDKQQVVKDDGTGLGMVEAARGWLVHRVEINSGKVTRLQIVAPTEWNFHSRGTFARGLNDRRGGPSPERLAQLMVAALDPCVPCQLRMVYRDTLPGDPGNIFKI